MKGERALTPNYVMVASVVKTFEAAKFPPKQARKLLKRCLRVWVRKFRLFYIGEFIEKRLKSPASMLKDEQL
jgi:hypothetical protein